MKIGLIDADLLDNGTRHPNLALMKLSGYHKSRGNEVELISNYDKITQCDHIFISKVFSYTKTPIEIESLSNVTYGGSGFFPEGDGPQLSYEIEHHMPDYSLYDSYIENMIENGKNVKRYNDYLNFSIGFTTRGCFRKCEFCINKKYDRAVRHASVYEFLDEKRKYIYLWDDNVLSFERWKEVFDELKSTKKKFQFRQGLDIRLMTKQKAEVVSESAYYGDFIFAFDDLAEENIVVKGIETWKARTHKTTKLYLLCAYKSIDIGDIEELFERIAILMKYQCLPFVMRHENYTKSKYKSLYTNIARWCNQPHIFKKMSFREFCLAHLAYTKSDLMPAALRVFNKFVEEHPDIASRYVDLKYMDYSG